MRFIPLIIFTIFTTTIIAQEGQLGKEELKTFRDFEGSQVNFEYDEDLANYIYVTQELKKASTDVTRAQVKLKAFIKLLKQEGDYCFGGVSFAFNLSRQGKGCSYNYLKVLIGYPSNIKKGDAIEYEFDLETDAKGNAILEGEEVDEFLSKSLEIKRPLTFNFFNNTDVLSSMTVSNAKVGQKLGGIISTRDKLMEKYIQCDE
ncbi:MAG: hypothetical protein GQ574_24325 [Crocinitomix sp.]|nr:hypothetical protein [Crocinitomix sp.]